MGPAGVLGTVTLNERSYIKIKTLCGKNPTEIHCAFSEVSVEFTVDDSMVTHWANCFCGGCVSIDNDPRPRKCRRTDERSVKLVADYVEDHCATREEQCSPTHCGCCNEKSL